MIIETQNGIVIIARIVLATIERAMNGLLRLYLSDKANGVMASGMAASIIEGAKLDGLIPRILIVKYRLAGRARSVKSEKNNTGIQLDNLPILDVPMKSPITTKTMGVTEALIIFKDDWMAVGMDMF